jgi:endogenous inhibitor of DNA gyrase (YacG/DUF329 family)
MKVNSDEVIEYHKLNPELSYAKIGLRFGKSRQRIHQILKEGQLTPLQSKDYERTCKECGEKFYRASTNDSYRFCSKECHDDYFRLKIICENCGLEFIRIRSDCNRGKHTFCSYRCHMKWEFSHGIL